jgi:heptosyltransferase-3
MSLRILVINVSRIGDTLLATPAIRAIAKAFPGAHITCLGHPKRVEILDHLPFIQRIGTITKNRALWRGYLSGKTYDWAFVYGFDRALVRYALRVASKVVAFRQGDPSIDQRLFQAVTPPGFQSDHAAPMQLVLPAAVGIAPAGRQLAYQVSEKEKQWATATLARLLPAEHRPLIGLQVASFPTKAFRDWPLEHFIGLCERIRKHYPNAYFLIFGGPLEKSRTEALHQRFPESSSLLAGRLTLRQTAALMNQLDLYVGVDTGPTHIMGSLHRPLVALYHPTSPSRLLGPLDHPCFYPVDHPLADKGATFDTPMADIEVEAVWRQAVAALANSGFPPHAADASVPEANTQPENGNLNGGSEQ